MYPLVVSFAGDALICVFPNKNSQSSADCKKKAIECGLKLKEHYTDRLTAHIAVSYGDLSFALLGGHAGNWVYAMSGPGVQQLSACIDEAHSKELVITPECFEVSRECLTAMRYEATSGGNWRVLDMTEDPSEVLPDTQCFADRFELDFDEGVDMTLNILSFVPVPVVSSLAARSFKSNSELREVTTVFVKLDSYDPVLHTDLTVLQPFVLLAQKLLALSGGVLRQFLVDDKGCVLIGLWGVPSASHSNNSHRAVVFSATLVKAARLIGHTCSIGVTTGNAFCGTIGSILRRDYVAMGDCVNMAARLMGKANGRVLVDDRSFASLPAAARGGLVQAEPMQLKGRDGFMQAYSLSTINVSGSSSGEEGTSTEGGQSTAEELFQDMTMTVDAQTATIMCPVQMKRLKGAGSGDEAVVEGPSTNLDPHVTSRLDDMVQQLQGKHMNVARRRGKSVCQAASGSLKCTAPGGAQDPLVMQYVLIEGPIGTGKTGIAQYGYQVSVQHKVRCVFVTASAEDSLVNYGLFRELFLSLVGDESFTTQEEQQKTIVSLLRRAYPTLNDKKLLTDKFPLVRLALQLSWYLCMDDNGGFFAVPVRSLPPLKRLAAENMSYLAPMEAAGIANALLETLLQGLPTTIVIDDVHHCDPLTWEVLYLMTRCKLPILLLLTALPSTLDRNKIVACRGGAMDEKMSSSGHGSAIGIFGCMSRSLSNYRKKMLSRTSRIMPSAPLESCWHDQGASEGADRSALSQWIPTRPNGTVLSISLLSLEQIRAILEGCLPQVEDMLVELVHSISSGHPVWVMSLSCYIFRFGVVSFMASVHKAGYLSLTAVEGSSAGAGNGAANEPSYSVGSEYDSPLLHSYIVSVVDTLPKHEQIVIKYAAVIGVNFSENVLLDIIEQGIIPRGEDAASFLRHTLSELEERCFIVNMSPCDNIYKFQSRRLRDIVYGLMPPR